MSVEYLKRATRTPDTETGTARTVVSEMLAAIEANGEQAVRDYALKLDRWSGAIVVTPEEIERRTRDVPASVKRDIDARAA
jgi:sulfopropanediol 3-dehydrogenase